MRKLLYFIFVSLMIFSQVSAQEDNGNKFQQVWHSNLDEFTKGYIVNAGTDIDGDGWGEFLLWEVTTETYLLYEAYGNDLYHIVYEDGELLNFWDLDRDGQLELVKIHQDETTLEQWMTIHEWNGVNLDASFAGDFSEATKTTNRIPRAFWYGVAEGHGFDRGIWDFKNFDGDENWDIIAVDAKLTMWGGQIARWNEGTIFNILELTNFDTDSPQLELRYTSGPIGDEMLFFGIWNGYIDIDKDGLLDNILISDHAQSLVGIRTAGNDTYDPIVVTRLTDMWFYHTSTYPIVANFDNDEYEEIYFADRDGQFWFTQSFSDFESTLTDYNIFLLKRIVKKQNEAGALNMCLGGQLGDQDGDGKPNIYYYSKDISQIIDVEYQEGFAGDSSSFTFTYTDMFFSNGEQMTATMWQMHTGTRYGNPLLDMDGDNKRELILGGVDTDNMVNADIATLYILESEHEAMTSVERPSTKTSEKFVLNQNYPNPFNPSTDIQYSLAKPGHVSLEVFSILGQRLATLINETQQVGTYNVRFDARFLHSGVYVYRLKTTNFTKQKKMLLIK
jgi:hypothetical protein